MDTNYSIIREQGEFMDPVELTEEENATVKAALKTESNEEEE